MGLRTNKSATGAHNGPADKGPGAPTRAWRTRAQEGPQARIPGRCWEIPGRSLGILREQGVFLRDFQGNPQERT